VPDSRSCPVCGDTARRILHRQRFHEGILGDGYDVVVCRACGAGFADGIRTQSELNRYYAEQSKYSYESSGGAESEYDLRRYEIIVEQVAPYLASSTARILEVGCATGGLLLTFKQRGFANVVGADPSPACAEAAQRLHGIEVRAATISHLSEWRDRFDLVLMIGVLEHLREVQPAVRTIVDRINPGGSLYVAVPDVEGLAECRNAPFQQFSMEHVNFFSAQSLSRTMGACGLVPRQTWRWMVEWRENVTEPVVSGLYQPSSGAVLLTDSATEAALERYIASSHAGDQRIEDIITTLVNTPEPVLIWGAGALTRRLLATTTLAKANIVGFVDSNPHQQGRQLVGKPIFAPAQIVGRSERILICSVAFEREIVQIIRDQLALSNQLITLYS